MFKFDILYGASTAASWMFGRSVRVPSLLDRTAAFVVSSWHINRTALNSLPCDVYEVLLCEACEALLTYKPGAPGLCLTHIIQRWPSPVLKLSEAVSRRSIDVKGHKKLTELIMHVVIGFCQPESCCKLSILDLSEIPLNGDICLKILQKISDALNGRALTVILDLTVDSENYKSLMHLFHKVQQCTTGLFKVQCRRLIINSLGKDKLISVINSHDPQVIFALNMDLNRLENEGISDILPSMSKLVNLQTISLTYNLINTAKDQTIAQVMSEAFTELHHLRRLNLSHNVLTGCLRTLLEPLSKSLESLYVCDCRLSSVDFSYLANSRHVNSLRELDLGSNNLKDEHLTFEKLLHDAGPRLEYLGLDDTHLHQIKTPLKLWGRCSKGLPKLIAVSMRGNEFTAENQVFVLKTLAKNSPSLVYVGVCMVYEPELEDEFFFDEWDVGNDRVDQFFELYNECNNSDSDHESESESATERVKTRSLIVHDFDIVNKRDAFIFIHNLTYKDNT